MDGLKKAGWYLYKLYVGIGMLAIGIITVCVISSAIMRYFFNVSFIFLQEFVTAVFTFSTFWGIGIAVLENEHIVIDVVFQTFPKKVRHALTIINHFLMLAVNLLMVYLSIEWISKAGKTMSNGLRIQLKYLYVILPIGFAVASVCVVVKLILLITGQDEKVRFKPEPDLDDLIEQMEAELSSSSD